MASKEAFEEALDEVKDKLERIGDRVEGEVEAPDGAEEGAWLVGCRHGDIRFWVVARPDREFFELLYPLDLEANLARQVREEDGLREHFEQERENAEPEETSDIAATLLDSMPPREKQGLVFHLVERLSSPTTSFRTMGTGGGGLARFECKKKIFPYEGTLTLARLNDAVQEVISVGHRATQFLYHSLVFDVTEDGELPVQLRFRSPAGVHLEGSETRPTGRVADPR